MDQTGLRPPSLRVWQPREGFDPLASGEVRVLIVDLGPRDCGDDDLTVFPEFRLLDEEERGRALRFVRPRDRRRFLIGRGTLRAILGRLTGTPPERLRFRAGDGGKPELEPGQFGPSRPPCFNVTHSADLALIALGDAREVGVDVERLRTIQEAERIVGSYFTPQETEQFSTLGQGERPTAFLRGWTRKEAILKARGVGLAGLATCYETMFGTGELRADFTPALPRPRIGGWTLWEAAPVEGYVAALAVGDLS